MMSIADSVDLVLHAFKFGKNGDIFVQKAPAATVKMMAKAILCIMGKKTHPIRIIGTRHGEKLHEALLSREELARAQDMGRYYRVAPDGRDLNYRKFFEAGEKRLTHAIHREEYNSANTKRLDLKETKRLILKTGFIQKILKGERNSSEK